MPAKPRAPRRRCRRLLVLASVLAAAPAHAQPALAPLPDLPVSRLERLAPGMQPPSLPVTRLTDRADLDARRLSLTFPQPLPIRDVLLVLVRDTPYSLVTDADVGGEFVGELRDLSMRQALEAVLFPAGLDYEVQGTLVRVFPRRPRTRLFEVDLLAVRRTWERRASGGEMTSATGLDVYSELEEGVRALLSPSGRHHVDRRAGLVQVTDFADRLDQIGIYLETVQVRATRQIRLDVRLYKVWPAEGGARVNLAALAARPGTGLRLAPRAQAGVIVEDLDAFLNALGGTGRVSGLAAPQLVSMNNEPAFVHVDSEFAGGERSMRSSTGRTALTLAVTPQISADGIVQLSIAPRFADGPTSTPQDGSVHRTLTEADLIVRVREGQSVVVSGLPGSPPGELLLLVTPVFVTPAVAVEEGTR